MISVRKFTEDLISALTSIGGLKVGRGQKPDGDPPYAVVYGIPGGRTAGTLDDPHEDAEMVYQVTCVGTTSEQAEWVTDRALGLAKGFPATGLIVSDVEVFLPGIQRDDDVTPPLFYATPRFTFRVTPA